MATAVFYVVFAVLGGVVLALSLRNDFAGRSRDIVDAWYAGTVDKIKKYAELECDWNGYDAPMIPPEVIAFSLAVVEEMKTSGPWVALWEVFPTGRETIQFETSQTAYVEVEIYKKYAVLFDQSKKSNSEQVLHAFDAKDVVEKMRSATKVPLMKKLSWYWYGDTQQ